MLETVTKAIQKIFGTKSEKDIKAITPIVKQVEEAYSKLHSLSNDELRAKTTEFKTTIEEEIRDEKKHITELKEKAESDEVDILDKEDIYNEIDKIEEDITKKIDNVLNRILPDAFAVLRETAKRFKENETIEVTASEFDQELAQSRDSIQISGDKAIWNNSWDAAGNQVTWDMIHYEVQVIGGIVMHQGKIAEMQTGEGKTLVATLPVYLNALSGRGVHLVTVNDYLARRDAEWMGPLYEFHGLSIDCVDRHQPNSEERRKAYQSDITYGTNNEFGFDYLRDNMANSPEDLVQRKPNFAIVDEVDSVLIDEARTPLIISGPTPKGDQHMFDELKPKVEKLVGEQRKLVNNLLTEAKKKLSEADKTEDKKAAGKMLQEGRLSLFRAYRGLPKNKALIKFLSEPGMRQQLQKVENHYLQDQGKEMPFVDNELFFVIDEKQNSVELTEKGIDLVTSNTDDKDFFILPDIATELSQIEKSEKPNEEKVEEKEALMNDFSVKTERVHTVDKLLKAYCMFEKDVEYVVMDNQVKIVDEQTGRIMDGRRYSDGLHQAIEAKENVKIEDATQTYATVTLQNYFRMYNKLAGMTGTAETEAGEFWEIYKLDVVVIPTNKPVIRDDRQDLVYKTAREKFNAVIDEVIRLREEGRPILVGTTSVEVSELLSRMLKMRKIEHQVLNAKKHQSEAEVVKNAGEPKTVTIATNMAGRGTDIKLTEETRQAGGLAIVGTERHESRRVDRQLRGRAGRQGDPGSSQFFVSLEDNLMRLFGSDRIAKLMDRLGHQDGEVIQHRMISNSIERAQKKVEENNFGIRKKLLEYDDVMNQQREVIYDRRKHALYGERLKLDIANSMVELVEAIVYDYHATKDFDGFNLELISSLHIESPISEDEFIKKQPKDIVEHIVEKAVANYQKRTEEMSKIVYPVVKRVHEDPKANYKTIAVPFTDGRKSLQVVADLEKSYNTEGTELVNALEKSVTLAMIDLNWKDHLREMDELRQSVQNAVYEQKDPLLIYKFESFELFKQIMQKVGREVISFLMKATLPQAEDAPVQEGNRVQEKQKQPQLQTQKEELPSQSSGPQYHDPSQNKEQPKPQPAKSEKTYGRNDKVTVLNLTTGEEKEVKYKQAEPLLKGGQWGIKE